MSSTNPALGSRVIEYLTLRPRLLTRIKVLLAIFALIALILNSPIAAAILIAFLLLILLLLPANTTELAPVTAPAIQPQMQPSVPLTLVEEVTRQLSSSLSIGQVANIVLTAALRATQADTALLALPVEVAHFMTIQLRESENHLEMLHRAQTGSSLVEQVIQHGQTLFNRDHTAFAVALRHEYLITGALYVESPSRTFTQVDATLLQAIAGPAAISLQNAQILDDQQYQINTLSHIQSLSQRLAGVVDREMVTRVMLETTRDLLGVQEVALYERTDKGSDKDAFVLRLSLHRDRFNHDDSEKLITQETALACGQAGAVQITRSPATCVAVPVEHEGALNEVLAVAFTDHHTLRHRDLTTLNLLASEVAAHFDTVALHEEIRAVSERLRVTINSARDGVLLLARDGTLVECNPSAERLLGIDKDRFLGKHFVAMLFEMMRTNEGNGLGYSRSQLTELARQLRLEPNHITRRQFTQMIGNQRTHVEEIGSPVYDAENRTVGRLLVLRDVTEQKLLSDFRDEITHMAVHDLRGPLTSIINGIDMTIQLGVGENPEDNERILRLSLESAQSLMRLVDSLLDIAKLESRRMPIQPQAVTARELIAAARETLDSSITQAKVRVSAIIPDDLPLIDADPDIIRRVLINLIDNAIRFTPEGGDVLIEVRHEEDEEKVAFRVSDSGPGIPPEDQALIFEQYRQSGKNKPLRGSKGTGLGLTFCKMAVEAHGGRIAAESSERLSGACFVITLPVETASSAIY